MTPQPTVPDDPVLEVSLANDRRMGPADRRDSEADRRIATRFHPVQLPHLKAALSGTGEVRLVDISATGARFQSERRFLPNAALTLRLVTAVGTVSASGRIVRSRMVNLVNGTMGYDVAVAFDQSVEGLIPPEA
jgi:hypothetical protein